MHHLLCTRAVDDGIKVSLARGVAEFLGNIAVGQQVGQGTPKAFLALLVFWLALLFASFGLFAPPNLTSAVTLTLCALAVAGAVGMIPELEWGFGGLIHISPQPMRQAANVLEKALLNE